ncbi:MAG: hypothetical protein Q8S31_07735 [Alphaproteobacteria bacterium]|nr:hypothetical protein [Alphaproteobacteria bacterium]
MKRAYDELNRFSWNEEELLTYDQAEKYEGTYIASMEQKYDEGLEKGEKIGIEKEKQIGLEKGQKIEKIKIAENLLNAGLDKKLIAQKTGLSILEINKISVKAG